MTLAGGSYLEHGEAQSSSEIYDVETNSWSESEPMIESRYEELLTNNVINYKRL